MALLGSKSWQVPAASMGKRVASKSADRQVPKWQKQTREVTSLGSMNSHADMEGQEEHSHTATASAPTFQQKATRSPKQPTTNVLVEGAVLDYMLTLLLKSSRRLSDLEATSYYTHVIPTNSPMYTALDNIYQSHLYTVSLDADHTMGPPMNHRGMEMLKQVLQAKESLSDKDGLKDLWPVVQNVVDQFEAEDMDIEGIANIIGHCKVYPMHDRTKAKLVFVMPLIVDCCKRTTTLGSVISRLLRSMGYERKTGVAPAGFLERKLKEALESR